MRLDPPHSLADLAEAAGRHLRSRLADLGGLDLPFPLELVGDGSVAVSSIRPIEALEPGCITFAVNRKLLAKVEASSAAAVIVPLELTPATKPGLRSSEPRLVFSLLLELALEPPSLAPGLPETIRFKDRSSVSLGPGCVIGDFCYLGAGVSLGRDCLIYPHVFLDDQVTMGDGCIVYPRVTIFRHTTLGRKVIVHSGAVIGDDGFGYTQMPDAARGRLYHLKNEHAGGVWIGDFVEIGNQVCVDRGLAGLTRIGEGTKIDNLVQIGHNCEVGRDCIIVAQAGLAGHARLGHRVMALAQTGLAPGAKVGDDAILTARAGVAGEIPAGRAAWSGSPAQPMEINHKLKAIGRRELPRLYEFFRLLKKADSFESLKEAFFPPQESPGKKEE
ncbi:MAG: UDP-3-O-(3-hydroxymyristoyl)glucosamine N-acyltransferase [Thermodesulfobacteriota bacterium]